MLISTWLELLAGLQSVGSPTYAAGLFPAQRFHRYLPYRREEDNVFFTASVAFILRLLRPHFTPAEQALADGIIARAAAAYPAYRNREGIPTYNFFPIGPDRHFPNGRFIHRHYTFRPADDADDTALIHLTQPHPPAETAWLKTKLAAHANGSQRWLLHNLPRYRGLRAYSTFFGRDMYIDLDICVLTNVLYWVLENGLPLTEHDHASLQYVHDTVQRREYLTHRYAVGPSYPYPVHTIYHLARLLAAHEVPALAGLRPQLLQDAHALLATSRSTVERALLATSLLRLGEPAPQVDLPALTPALLRPLDARFPSQLRYDFEGYDLFYVNPLAFLSHPWMRHLDALTFFHMRCRCPALFLSYLLEYHTLRTRPLGGPAPA